MELGVRVTKDARWLFGDIAQDVLHYPYPRPQRGMYEALEPLFANPVLPLLAIASADPAFQEAPPVASLLSYFKRTRCSDPPRDRLASSLFLSVPLRGVQGRRALQDMSTLCEGNSRVAYRPNLEPENGHCRVPQHARTQSPQAA